MENDDHKNTWEGFTKFVLWGTIAVITILVILGCNIIIKINMIVGSTKEDISLEKRVALTPEAAKNIIGLGLKICVEKNYADHIGIKDEEFKKAGVEIKNSSNEVLNSCNLLIKLIALLKMKINNIKEKTILIGMLNPSQNKNRINDILKKKY